MNINRRLSYVQRIDLIASSDYENNKNSYFQKNGFL